MRLDELQSVYGGGSDAPIHSTLPEGILNSSHLSVLEETQAFANNVVIPVASEIRQSGVIPKNIIDKLRSQPWFGLTIPSDYGGMGLDCLARILNVQTLTRACPDLGAILQIGQLGVGGIVEFGSETQKNRWLPELAAGRRICTISITEEHSGSHVKGLRTSYKETPEGFILNGEKIYIGNAPISDLHVVYARSLDNDDEISAFIVENERQGVDVSKAHSPMGLRGFPFGRVSFEDCLVPRDAMLGERGKGLGIAYKIISDHGRPSLTALALGIHRRVLDVVLQFAEQRHLYGDPIKNLPEVREKIFEVYRNYEISQQSAYNAAHLASIGAKSFRAFAVAKNVNGDLACKSALTATEIFGARAGFAEYEIGQLLLDAIMTRPPSGTGDVQRKRALEDLLGERRPGWEAETPASVLSV